MNEELKKLFKEIEDKFSAYAKRIADLANQLTKVDEVISSHGKLLKACEDNGTFLVKLSHDIAYKENDKNKFLDYLQTQINEIHILSSNFAKSFHELVNEFQSFKCLHYTLEGKNSLLEQSVKEYINNHSDQDKKFSEIHKKIDKSDLEKDFFKDKLDSFCSKVDFNQEKQAGIVSNLESIIRSLNDLSDSRIELQKKLDKIPSELASQSDKKIKELSSSVDQKLSELVIPDVSNFLIKKDLDLMQHQLNLATLDAKNANARSNAIEMQFQILNKKVEGMLIQLKA